MIGDGICDDLAEDELDYCMHDGGDCCTSFIDDSRCTDCLCSIDQQQHATSFEEYLNLTYFTEFNPRMIVQSRSPWSYWSRFLSQNDIGHHIDEGRIGGGYCKQECRSTCDDWHNFPSCEFDCGECCLPWIESHNCDECICHLDGTVHQKLERGDSRCHVKMLNDGKCHSWCNNPENLYDGGDCCLPIILTEFCYINYDGIQSDESDLDNCICAEDGTLHSTEFDMGCPFPVYASNRYRV